MSPLFSVIKPQIIEALRGLLHLVLMGILGAVLAWLTNFIPGFLPAVFTNPVYISIALGVDHGLVKILTSYISDENGKIGGVL